MEKRRLALFRDLQDLHVRLLECYDLAEELRYVPRLSVEIDGALAGLHYSVAKATQDAGTLLEDARLWGSSWPIQQPPIAELGGFVSSTEGW